MNCGEVWLAEVGRKRRPVLVLTRPEVLDVRSLVTVAEITATSRGLAAEVEVDHEEVGLKNCSVINCDGLHTIAQSTLTRRVGMARALGVNHLALGIGDRGVWNVVGWV